MLEQNSKYTSVHFSGIVASSINAAEEGVRNIILILLQDKENFVVALNIFQINIPFINSQRWSIETQM